MSLLPPRPVDFPAWRRDTRLLNFSAPIFTSGFNRMMSTQVLHVKVPHFSGSFHNRITKGNSIFIEFCHCVDSMNKPTVVGRREMEGAWAQYLMREWELWVTEESKIQNRTFEAGESTLGLLWEWLHYVHEGLVKAFFQMTTYKIENYWAAKPANFNAPLLDVSSLPWDSEEDHPFPCDWDAARDVNGYQGADPEYLAWNAQKAEEEAALYQEWEDYMTAWSDASVAKRAEKEGDVDGDVDMLG